MSGLIPRATELAHLLLARAAGPGDTVIDATAGQGRDTCFLAALVGGQGQVWAFDIQEEAVSATTEALKRQGLDAQARVICDDHANIAAYDIGAAAAAVFNLGWLPGGDHRVTSGGPGTVQALQASLDKLKTGGALVVVAYPGHPVGAAETKAVLSWLAALPADTALSMQVSFPGKEQAPVVLLIEKTGVGGCI